MMPITDPLLTANMTDHQRGWFFAEYEQARRDEVIGVLLALFLGSFGLHHFYLRRSGLGVLYLLLSWTGIPGFLGLIEAFFMPSRVRQYNAEQAAWIASQIAGPYASGPFPPGPFAAPGVYTPSTTLAAASTTVACAACGGASPQGAAFCPHCGTATAKQA